MVDKTPNSKDNEHNSNNNIPLSTPPLPEIKDIENKLTTILIREVDNHKTIKVDKSQQPYTYSLTEKGIEWVEKVWKEFKEEVRAGFEKQQEEEQRKCFHYSNLQPLWARDNISKGNRVMVIS